MSKNEMSVVETARERFKRAKEYYTDPRQLAIEDTKFAMGDSDNGWQWPSSAANSRTDANKVCLTVNVTAQHCNQIINNIRQNRPAVKVSPVDNFSDKDTAEILGGLIRNIQVASSSDDAHDLAAEHAIYGGEGYWRVLTEYESETSFDQVITIAACPNPNLVYIDPNSKKEDRSDAEWGFIFEDVPASDITAAYPDLNPETWEEDVKTEGWQDEDTVRVAEYFYCVYKNDEVWLLDTGESVLASSVPGGAAVNVEKTRKTRTKKWMWCKLVGGHDKPVDEREWAGKYLPIVTVVGKEINVDGEIVRKGIVRDLKDTGRMVNYAYSETVQTLAMQNKVPYLAAAESIEGHEDDWSGANLDNETVLPYNAFDSDGHALPAPVKQTPASMATAQIQLLQLSTEQMRAASGQQNANFGIKSEAQSGIGIQRLKAQGEIATFHFPDNLARALRYEAVVLIDLIQNVYDTERVVRVLGLDGKEDHAVLRPDADQPYAEEKDNNGDVRKIFNPQVGRYDVVIETGPSFHTQRQEAAANLNELAAKNPRFFDIAGDLIMSAQDFPMADQFAERIAKTLPPELQDNDDKELPPKAMQIINQANQQLQQMDDIISKLGEENEQLKQEKAAKMQDNNAKVTMKEMELEEKRLENDRKFMIDKYEALTGRMEAMEKTISTQLANPAVAIDIEA